jgi:hypothetical protein
LPPENMEGKNLGGACPISFQFSWSILGNPNALSCPNFRSAFGCWPDIFFSLETGQRKHCIFDSHHCGLGT